MRSCCKESQARSALRGDTPRGRRDFSPRPLGGCRAFARARSSRPGVAEISALDQETVGRGGFASNRSIGRGFATDLGAIDGQGSSVKKVSRLSLGTITFLPSVAADAARYVLQPPSCTKKRNLDSLYTNFSHII